MKSDDEKYFYNTCTISTGFRAHKAKLKPYFLLPQLLLIAGKITENFYKCSEIFKNFGVELRNILKISL